jgi:hypothetical protein
VLPVGCDCAVFALDGILAVKYLLYLFLQKAEQLESRGCGTGQDECNVCEASQSATMCAVWCFLSKLGCSQDPMLLTVPQGSFFGPDWPTCAHWSLHLIEPQICSGRIVVPCACNVIPWLFSTRVISCAMEQ